MAQGKNTVKSFVRENKFHTYLTRESLSAEERVSKFHNHGKTPSYQTFADSSVRKFVPKSHGKSLEGMDEKALFVLRLGPSVTIILVELSAVVRKIAQTTRRMVQFMEENSIYTKQFGRLHWL